MLLENSIAPVTDVAYEIDNSLRFNDDDSAYLTRTPSAGNQKTWTWAGWVKPSYTGSGQKALFSARSTSTDQFHIWFNGVGTLDVESGGGYGRLVTSAYYRDPSAWYHFVVVLDATNATTADKCRIYVNGSRVTDFSSTTNFSDRNYGVNSAIQHRVGSQATSAEYYDGHMAEVHFIDGQALDPSNFGETGDYGEWKPIKYTGTYGSNGFYLDFENSGSLGADVSGNGNNWTPTNLAATDQMLDSPTNNFGTLNPVSKKAGTTFTFSEGNLKHAGSNDSQAYGTLGVTSGKHYFEHVTLNTTGHPSIGVANSDEYNIGTDNVGEGANAWTIWTQTGDVRNSATTGGSTGGFVVGDILNIAYDVDAGKIWFGKNNVWEGSGDPANGTNPTFSNLTGNIIPLIKQYAIGAFNFGQDSSFAGNKPAQGNTDDNGYGDFYYAPPTGYLALCTQNLPDATVIPSEHFNTVIYTGNGSTQTINMDGITTGVDFVWIKNRSALTDHWVIDKVRGDTLALGTNNTLAEGSIGGLVPLGSSSFDVGNHSYINASGNSYVAWALTANGAGVSNTDGTITSTVSANTSAGFSIVSYTGNGSANQTVGHGLSKAPEIKITKSRSNTNAWRVTDDVVGVDNYLALNSTSATASAGSGQFPLADATTLNFGTSAYECENGLDFIAYCFHSVEGFSKVGSYTGNGSTDGTFVYTGFKPAYVMTKRTDAADNWQILDGERDTYNTLTKKLTADTNAAEVDNTNNIIDFTSNGFKLRDSNIQINASGGTYIYIAFAENPFKHTNAR